MNIHDSVSYCKHCDLYVAADHMDRCEHCTAWYCPGCMVPTSDPDLFCCSERCAMLFDYWQKRRNERCLVQS